MWWLTGAQTADCEYTSSECHSIKCRSNQSVTSHKTASPGQTIDTDKSIDYLTNYAGGPTVNQH